MSDWRKGKPPKRIDRAILYGKLLTYCCSQSDRGKPFAECVDVGVYRIGRWWCGSYECLPTHWQPMPKPPKVKVKANA